MTKRNINKKIQYMIKLFEDFNKPDLRKIGTFVLCVKDHKKFFIEDNYYKVFGCYGDPEEAIEKYGINDYMPVECIYRIGIYTKDNHIIEFKINSSVHSKLNAGFPDFFEYFEIPENSDVIDKFNI